MRQYMQSFADRNLKNKITFDTEVLKISRQSRLTEGQNWYISVVNKLNGESRDIRCDRIVMCSGVRAFCCLQGQAVEVCSCRDVVGPMFLKLSHRMLRSERVSKGPCFIQLLCELGWTSF